MFNLRLLSAALLAATSVHGCALETRQDAPPDFMTIGNDGPADMATLGFSLNHLSLNVRNLTASMDFYGKVLGMRHLFTAQLSKDYSVTYMGHAQGGKNGTGFQTGEELLREKNNAAGMIEFQYFAASKDDDVTASTVRTNTFSHIGLIVPSLEEAQKRFEEMGVTVTKKIGLGAEGIKAVENAWGFGETAGVTDEQREELIEGQKLIGFSELIAIEDPDGNILEVQQLVPPPGVA